MPAESSHRLQKILAQAGVASRRMAERIIEEGRVKVNGQSVTQLGTRVNWAADVVEVDGKVLVPPQEQVYILLNKPRGYITSLQDPQGRPKVTDLVSGLPCRVFPVGRLDLDSQGLLLLTNDGDLSYRLTHPSFGVEKTYQAKVLGLPKPQKLKSLCQGILLEDGPTAPAKVRLLGQDNGNALLEITLHEGRKRQVRRMCEHIGHPVMELNRTGYGFLKLDGVKSGCFRYLSEEEIRRLRQITEPSENSQRKKKKSPVRKA